MASVWRGQVSFGLVSFPVQLHTAARSKSVAFNMLHKGDHSRLKQVMVCQAENKPIERGEIVKGFEYSRGQYVVVDDEDFARITPKTSRVMEILEFVPLSGVDPVYLERSYWLQPSKGGEKAYALLHQALRDSGLGAVAKVSMYKREHVIILRPGERGMAAHTMFYEDEIQAAPAAADPSLVSEKELAMARMLVSSMEAAFEPAKYRDEFRESIQGMIDAKVQGREVVGAVEERPLAPVIDIMEALRASIERKPVAKAAQPVKKARKAR